MAVAAWRARSPVYRRPHALPVCLFLFPQGEKTLTEEDCKLVEKNLEKAVKARAAALPRPSQNQNAARPPPWSPALAAVPPEPAWELASGRSRGGPLDFVPLGPSLTSLPPASLAALLHLPQEKQQFDRVEISRDEALAMFLENKFKVELITSLPQDARITVYRVGPMVDLCRGPHIPSTAFLKAVAVTGASRSFWRGDVTKDPLQRVYAITFPDNKLLKEYKHRIEEAKKRDHRVVGPHQELFFFHQLSPGSCFFLPHGGRIYNALVEFIREKYWEFEYEEARGACSLPHPLPSFPFGHPNLGHLRVCPRARAWERAQLSSRACSPFPA